MVTVSFGWALLASAVAMAVDPASAAPAVTHDDGVESHARLDEVYQRFHQGYADLDADAVASLYTEEALYLSPQRDMKRGRTEIQAGFARMFAGATGKKERLDIQFRIVKREVREDLATDVGYYTLTRTSPSAESSDRGKFVVVAERDGRGVWRFAVDGYSSTKPWEPRPAPSDSEDAVGSASSTGMTLVPAIVWRIGTHVIENARASTPAIE